MQVKARKQILKRSGHGFVCLKKDMVEGSVNHQAGVDFARAVITQVLLEIHLQSVANIKILLARLQVWVQCQTPRTPQPLY